MNCCTLIIMCDLLEFGCQEVSVVQKILDKDLKNIWTFTVTLTLNIAIQFLLKTLHNMMLYQQNKFSGKESRLFK